MNHSGGSGAPHVVRDRFVGLGRLGAECSLGSNRDRRPVASGAWTAARVSMRMTPVVVVPSRCETVATRQRTVEV